MGQRARAGVSIAAGLLAVLAACGEVDDADSVGEDTTIERRIVDDSLIQSDLYPSEFFALPTTPALPRWSSAETGSPVRNQRSGVIAVFDNPGVALDAGQRVHDLLVGAASSPGGGSDLIELTHGSKPPPTSFEVDALAELGLPAPSHGIGWVGADRATGPAVSVLGSVVTVADLLYVDTDEILVNPIHEVLLALGATRTIGEFDWAFDYGAAVDLACVVPDPVPTDALLDLADFLSAAWRYDVLAPWEAPLTDEQRRLRRSRRLLEERLQTASGVIMNDPAELAREIDELVEAGQDPSAALREALTRDGAADPSLFEGIDPVVTEWYITGRATTFTDADEEARTRATRRAEHSAALGAPAIPPSVSGARQVLGRIGSGDWQIDFGAEPVSVRLARVTSNSLARTLPHLIDHLVDLGCTDITVAILDLDEE